MKKLPFIIIGALIVLFAPVMVYYVAPAGKSDTQVKLEIVKGDGVREISSKLERMGLIRSPRAFIIYSFVSGSASRLKAGTYELSPAMSVFSAVRALRSGPDEDVSILVREGETLPEIEAKLVQAKVLKKGELAKFPGKSLEGFLFPDTYRFFFNSSPESVVERFMSNFYRQAIPVLTQGPELRIMNNELSIYEKLIIASILEKEVPFHEDRRLVAGVLYKRLSIGMALQVDAAPVTYERPGLPPKPIANPGLDAIRAAVNPQASEYLYYLSDPKTKRTIFSKTFDEHVQNKFKYLK